LEADLLHRLATAEGDILDNISLIENLEKSKKLSTEINEKVEIAKVTEIAMMTELTRIHSFYKYSLDSVIIVINRAIDKVAAAMNPKKEEKPPLEEG
jgi:dynein heavy chain